MGGRCRLLGPDVRGCDWAEHGPILCAPEPVFRAYLAAVPNPLWRRPRCAAWEGAAAGIVLTPRRAGLGGPVPRAARGNWPQGGACAMPAARRGGGRRGARASGTPEGRSLSTVELRDPGRWPQAIPGAFGPLWEPFQGQPADAGAVPGSGRGGGDGGAERWQRVSTTLRRNPISPSV